MFKHTGIAKDKIHVNVKSDPVVPELTCVMFVFFSLFKIFLVLFFLLIWFGMSLPLSSHMKDELITNKGQINWMR